MEGLFEDRLGDRYTTHTFADDKDPWRGAIILTQGVVDGLKRDGMLPLKEVKVPVDE